MNKFKVGDRVRVVNAEFTFGDYENGDEATVVGLDKPISAVIVKWHATRFEDQRQENNRCTLLYLREVEPVVAEIAA